MTVATIVVIAIGLVIIIVSFMLTGKDEAVTEEEKTTPGLREELTDADKRQLKRLTDNYIREYSKKQVKETVKNSVDAKIQESISGKQPAIDQKVSEIDSKLAEIDSRSQAGVQELTDQAAAISAGWDQNRQEVETVYNQITEKEKELKIQLNLIDEYKKGLEKLKEDADLSVDRLKQLQEVEISRTVASAAVEAAVAVEASDNAADETDEADEAEAAVEAADEAEEAVEEAVEEADDEADEAEEAVEEAVEEAADEADEAEEAEDEADEAEEAADEAEEAVGEAVEEAADEADEAEEAVEEAEDEAEEADDEADEAEEEAAAEPVSDDLDDYDDFDEDFDDDEDDLKAITNLDQILDREGIDLTAEDPTVNILTMYGAGLSIIEISKVLKMGVGEVKYIIDSNTAN